MPFTTFLDMQGIEVLIERDGQPLKKLRGLFNAETNTKRKYCGFLPDTDIRPNDWIVKTDTGERLFVVDTKSQSFRGKTESIKAFYQTGAEHENSTQNTQQPIFNIQNAYGSVIGIGNTASFSYQNAVNELRETIESSESPDKEELKQIVSLLEMVVKNQVPASKGLFSKFSGVMERNSWISSAVASAIMTWLLSRIS